MTREEFIKELEYTDDVWEPSSEPSSKPWPTKLSVHARCIAVHDAEQRQIIDEQVEENRGLRRDVLLLQTELTKLRQQIREYETRAWGYAKRTPSYWELRNRIEKMLDDRADIITNGDGYKVFWPSEDRGYHAAYELRIVADILDDRNKVRDAIVNQELRRSYENS